MDKPMKMFIDLPQFDGFSAYNGAIRFFPDTHHHTLKNIGIQTIDEWNDLNGWRSAFGNTEFNGKSFAEDSFGNQFIKHHDGHISIFWPDTGDIQTIVSSMDHFVQAVHKYPQETILLDEYIQGCKWKGKPDLSQHFAWIVAPEDGGDLSSENLVVLPSVQHMFMKGTKTNNRPAL
jgi:hypothetical protein